MDRPLSNEAENKPRKPAPNAPDARARKPRQRFRQWHEPFLEALRAEAGSASAAAKAAGIDRKTAYRARDKNPAFAAEWDEIVNAGNDLLEGSAMRRAIWGTKRTKYHLDKPIGEEVVHETNLTTFMLERRIPQRYGRDAATAEGNTPEDVAAKMLSFMAAARAQVAPPPDVVTLQQKLAAQEEELARLRAAAAPPPPAVDPAP